MAHHPHIIFPTPGIAAQRRLTSGPSPIHRPARGRQIDRLAPVFAELEQAFQAHRVALRSDMTGIEPEEVLVLETAGRVEDFVKALQGMRGLEWLGDIDIDEIAPDEDFYIGEHEAKNLPGRLYLVMTNQQGLRHLLSMWRLYEAHPDAPPFARGRMKWRDLFDQLHAVRPWGPEDRLRETGLEDELNDIVPGAQEVVVAEIELWYRAEDQARRVASEAVKAAVGEAHGSVTGEASIPDIRYHALLATLPLESAREIVRHEGSLVRMGHVLDIRPAGQSVSTPTDQPEADNPSPRAMDPVATAPVVAMLDGLPLQQHQAYAGALVVDDPDGWEETYPVSARNHGTAMASLILRGDLTQPGASSRPLYVRPILRPDVARPNQPECFPRDVLPIDLVHRAIRRLFEGSAEEGPAAPSVRIINHSVADRRREFFGSVGAWARLLDYLAWKYSVLIIVPTGNYDSPLTVPGLSAADLQAHRDTLGDATLNAMALSPSARRLISPAEGINVLTVGAIHSDQFTGNEGVELDPLPAGMPSPVSRHGPGFRRSVKPDLALPGGRQPYSAEDSVEGALLRPRHTGRPPGQLVACPNDSGSLTATRYSRGTSNATALASRAAATLYEMLGQLRDRPGGDRLDPQHEAVILKALLVHGATWPDLDALAKADPTRDTRDLACRLVGYGELRPDRVLASEDNRVTLIGWGTLTDGSANQFEIPLPPSLSGERGARRLTVTLAWLSPVSSQHRAYRRVALWFDPYGPHRNVDDAMASLGLSRLDTNHARPKRGTVQHEVFTGEDAAVFEDGRRCVVQVNCRAETEGYEGRVRYGLAVTIESAAALPLYEEIASRIRPAVGVTTTAP